jgi:glycosyl hydrolase family 99/SH3 domain-containing protein
MPVRRFLRACTLLLCALVLTVTWTSSTSAGASPRVLAFYYDWFDSNTWNSHLVSDLPSQPYVSGDPAAITRHIQQAQSAGIDAFVVSWTGQNSPTDTNFRAVLGAAQPNNFAATIDFEAQHFATDAQIISALSYVRDTFMPHPSFLREGGKPVLFFWREQILPVSDWVNIRAAVDPNHQQIWIAEGVDISYQQLFDGHHLYSVAWSPDVNATMSDWAGRVHRAGADKLWVATVMPGYDDTRTTRPDRFARSRDDGNFYRATWQAAINSRPDWVIITSFNEWVEGTQIEPSVSYGSFYLDLTRELAAQFKSGALDSQVIPPPSREQINQVTLNPDQRRTTDVLRVRAGPGTDYDILGRLRQGAVIEILARSEDGDWLQIAYPNPDNIGWVSAEFVAPPGGLDAFPLVAAFTPTPQATPTSTPEAGPDSGSDDSVYPIWY